MGMLLCEQNFRDVWIRNESVRAEIGQILHTDTHTDTHTHAAKLVVEMVFYNWWHHLVTNVTKCPFIDTDTSNESEIV